jgi:hypothetical protein
MRWTDHAVREFETDPQRHRIVCSALTLNRRDGTLACSKFPLRGAPVLPLCPPRARDRGGHREGRRDCREIDPRTSEIVFGRAPHCSLRYSPCGTSCSAQSIATATVAARDCGPLALGMAVAFVDHLANRTGSSSNRKPSSPGIVRASACSGCGKVTAASVDEPSPLMSAP